MKKNISKVSPAISGLHFKGKKRGKSGKEKGEGNSYVLHGGQPLLPNSPGKKRKEEVFSLIESRWKIHSAVENVPEGNHTLFAGCGKGECSAI